MYITFIQAYNLRNSSITAYCHPGHGTAPQKLLILLYSSINWPPSSNKSIKRCNKRLFSVDCHFICQCQLESKYLSLKISLCAQKGGNEKNKVIFLSVRFHFLLAASRKYLIGRFSLDFIFNVFQIIILPLYFKCIRIYSLLK